MDKQDFINPKASYHGKSYTPENLIFNANLQEFSSQVGLIVGLETGGKITAEESYKKIKQLWKQLKASKKNLINSEKPCWQPLSSTQ